MPYLQPALTCSCSLLQIIHQLNTTPLHVHPLQETERPLPPGWHMSGPQNVDFSGAKFPVSLVEADADGGGAALRRFLERDQGESHSGMCTCACNSSYYSTDNSVLVTAACVCPSG